VSVRRSGAPDLRRRFSLEMVSNRKESMIKRWLRGQSEDRPLPQLFAGSETRCPSHQNAVDMIPGWSSRFPSHFGIEAGTLPLFHDSRIAWAIESFGDLSARSVLELGPLEAAHTSMLAQAGAHVDAIESNQLAYFKCLITREILGFPNVRFHLGDFVQALEQNDKTYDFIVACGVLYHMRDPLRLIQAIARRTTAIYLWTVVVDDDDVAPIGRQSFNGVDVRLYQRGYGKRDISFCGGPRDNPLWMHQDDILAVLKTLDFSNLTIAHKAKRTPGNDLPILSVFATASH
jgi:SAM-dependent methyltransferase